MAKNSWPSGVTSWDDTVKFAELVFGKGIAIANYSDRLPHPSQKSFLLFAKGACAEGRPLHKIADLIEPHLEEIGKREIKLRNNHARPTKSQQMLFLNDVHCFFNDIHTIGIHCFFMVFMSCVNVFMLFSHFFTTGFVAFFGFSVVFFSFEKVWILRSRFGFSCCHCVGID